MPEPGSAKLGTKKKPEKPSQAVNIAATKDTRHSDPENQPEPLLAKTSRPEPDPAEEQLARQVKEFRPVSFEQILAAWPKILERVKNEQSSLLTVLQNAKLKGMEDNCLALSFVYKIHKDNLEIKKNAGLLTGIIEEHFNAPVSLSVTLERDHLPAANAADLALEVFGGELV